MNNKVVLITGGSSGIGKACAFAFGKAGAKIAITGRNEATLQKAGNALAAAGIDAITVQADVSSMADCHKMVQETLTAFGKIDVLINNAGISMRALFEEADVDVIRKVMDINFYGTVYATKAALPEIIKNKGSIAGISSIAGYRGLPARTGYCSSKFAMQGFLESLRVELLKKGVHVLVAAPGFTASNIRNTALSKDGSAQKESPLNEQKIMSAETVANYILKAVRKRKRDIVLTSQGKMTIFLNKWFPGFMDKMVYKHFAKEKDSPLKK